MRRRTLSLATTILALVALAACDAPGMPPTATPKIDPTNTTITLRPTATSVTVRATATAEPTSIAGATETSEPLGTPAGNSAQVEEVINQTIEMRGLEPKGEITNNVIPREQLRKNLLEEFKKDYSREEARVDAVELWMLRLIKDRSLDLYQLYIDFYTESIAGYYDDETDNMYIIAEGKPGDKLSPQSRQTLAHEYVHALQDQHFDLEQMLPDDSKEYDRDLARRSLVEGDAQRFDLMYALKYFTREEFNEILQGSGNPTPAFDSAPNYIKEGFIFPYIKGVAFVDELLRDPTGFRRVDRALADPPTSVEQILHPDKYIDSPRDEPTQVTLMPLTDTLGTGWKYADGGTFGEFDLDLLLSENGVAGIGLLDFDVDGERDAERAAAGWDGGYYDLYENGEQALLYLDTRWDNPSEANEFKRALERSFAAADKDGDYFSDSGRIFAMGSEEDRVYLISSTDKASLDKVLAAVR